MPTRQDNTETARQMALKCFIDFLPSSTQAYLQQQMPTDQQRAVFLANKQFTSVNWTVDNYKGNGQWHSKQYHNNEDSQKSQQPTTTSAPATQTMDEQKNTNKQEIPYHPPHRHGGGKWGNHKGNYCNGNVALYPGPHC